MNDALTLRRVDVCRLPTSFGVFSLIGYQNAHGDEHVALTMGQWQPQDAILVRVHSECLTGDALFSSRCDCGAQLEAAMKTIAENGCGVIVYLRQEGRGIGLINKIRAYHLQDDGLDTVEANQALGFPADMRDFSYASQILRDLGIQKVRLLTNNPAKRHVLEQDGIEIVERIGIVTGANAENQHYLKTKAQKMGHLFPDFCDPNKT